MQKGSMFVMVVLLLSVFMLWACGGSDSLVPMPQTYKAFVTNSTINGGIGNLASADQLCQGAALNAGLSNPDNYRAWLSNSIINAPSRINADGPWYRLDGTMVASNMADILDGTLNAGITFNEYGDGPVLQYAWTGTTLSGTSSANTCTDWSDNTSGAAGTSGFTNSPASGLWVAGGNSTCNTPNRLYCLEDKCTLTGKIVDTYNQSVFDVPGNTLAINAYSDMAQTMMVTNTLATVMVNDVAYFSLDITGYSGETLYFSSPNLNGTGGGLSSVTGGTPAATVQCGATLYLINQS